MITYLKKEEYSFNVDREQEIGSQLVEIACLSADTKPTEDIANGSICLEMDTGTFYMYDEDGEQWVEIGA